MWGKKIHTNLFGSRVEGSKKLYSFFLFQIHRIQLSAEPNKRANANNTSSDYQILINQI